MTWNREKVQTAAKRQKWARKLAQVAALSAVMLAFGATPSHASPITETFTSTNTVQDYFFGQYVFRLGFDYVLGDGMSVTVNDVLVPSGSGPAVSGLDGYNCADIALNPSTYNPSCVQFVVTLADTSNVPQSGVNFAGNIHVGLGFGVYGYPVFGVDPVDLGTADSFSYFMEYGLAGNPSQFALVHFPDSTSAGSPTSISVAQCTNTSNISTCAAQTGFSFTVPEPATLPLLGLGLFGLVFLRRRLA